MKLEQIFEDYDPEQIYPDSKLTMDGNRRKLGQGSFATATTDDYRNFGDVKRTPEPSEVYDAGQFWLEYVYALKSDNPYLPRVKEIGNEVGKEYAVSERLVPFDAKGYINNEQVLDKLVKAGGSAEIKRMDWMKPEDIAYKRFIRNVEYALSGDTEALANITDPKLREAVQIIRACAKAYRQQVGEEPTPDLLPTNIMWRPSQYGPQIVFTDPMAILL